jgi:hypothetical protein
MFMELLDSEGFSGQYDRVSLFGAVNQYAFVNFTNCATAIKAHLHFAGFREWAMDVSSEEVCEVHWTKPFSPTETKHMISRCKRAEVAQRNIVASA